MSLAEPELRSQLVVTLLAILELAKLKVVRVLQSPDGETLYISQVSADTLASARRVEVTSAAEEAVAPADDAAPAAASAVESSLPVEAQSPTEAAPAAVDPTGEAPAEREDKHEQT